jgi:hypothetical protein
MKRIQFDLPNERLEELEQLRLECGLATKKDLFNSALTLFAWAVRQRREGRTVASLDERNNSYRELEMPALEAAAKKGAGWRQE